MPVPVSFEEHAERYERWIDEHEYASASELDARGRVLADSGFGVAVGVGSGRFAVPAVMAVGPDPSRSTLGYAPGRGIDVVGGVGERLPFRDETFDTVLMGDDDLLRRRSTAAAGRSGTGARPRRPIRPRVHRPERPRRGDLRGSNGREPVLP